MRDLIRQVRERLVTAPNMVCTERATLLAEGWEAHADDPPPLMRAHAFAHVLGHMTLDVHSNPIFAANTSSRPGAWMLQPEHGLGIDPQVLVEREGLEGFLDGALPEGLDAFWRARASGNGCGLGHLAVDLDAVVHEGLAKAEALAMEALEEGSLPQQAYRQAMLIGLRAVMHWAQRCSWEAEKAARREPDPLVRSCLERVAEACAHVPAHPARNLFEGLQAIVLVHNAIFLEGHGMSVSVGLPDRVLRPFIRPDTDAEELTCLAAAFMLKLAGVSLYGAASKTQAITIGGIDCDGRDQSNAVTLAFLDAIEIARVGDPHVFLRWHEHVGDTVKQRASELLATGASMPLLVGDGATAQGFVDAGVSTDDAYDYCVIGCNELGIPGRSAESAVCFGGNIQYVEPLNETLHGLPDPDAVQGMAELLDCLEQHMQARALQQRCDAENSRGWLAEESPTPFTSALMQGCIRKGRDLRVGMKYHLPGVYERGLSNAANALAAIEEVVYRQRRLSLGGLCDALRQNYADPSVRRLLLAAPKWGNDDDRADRWAVALVEMRERVLAATDTVCGGAPHMSCHVVRSLHHTDGRQTGASADGRRAGEPLSDSIGASQGTALAGPTAVMSSVLKLEAARHYRGGTNLNVTLARGDASPAAVRSMADAFFGAGGQELQISVLDAETLRAAQRHPQDHGDLIVRIAGFSSRFVDLSRTEQDELIARALAAACPGRGALTE